MTVTLTDVITYKRLVAAGNDDIWYESMAGTFTELDTSAVTNIATGPIDTSDQLVMFEGFQKVFVVNGAKLRVADFINTKIVDDNGFTNVPVKGTIVYQNGSVPAQILVDYANSTGKVLYGYVISGTVEATTAIRTAAGGGGDVIMPSPAAPVSKPHWYDWTVYNRDSTTYGSLPNKAYLGCLYRGRAVLSGNPEEPYQWYMSRQMNPWDFAYAANDAQSPVKGGNSDAGEIGDIIRALIPYKDDYLIFGCATSMWFLAGDPMEGGTINEMDLTVGMFGANSWCFDGEGVLYFWGTNGIYVTGIPGTPKCITEVSLPDLVNDEAADPSTHRITMAYDRKRVGILICITKLADGTNSCYWYDLRAQGLFPESYPTSSGPYSLFYYPANDVDYRDLLVGCKDGYIRKFNSSLKSDNVTVDDAGVGTTAISSYVDLGPVPMSQDAARLGKLTTPNLITAGGGVVGGSQTDSNNVAFKLYTADSAEVIIEKLYADTAPSFAGTFTAPGRRAGSTRKQKIKGAFLGVRLSNSTVDESWGFERFIGDIVPAGRIK